MRQQALRSAAVAALVVATLAGCAVSRPDLHPGPWAPPEPAAAVDPVSAYAQARLASMTLEEKIASLLMVHVGGTDPAVIREYLDRFGLAGTMYLANNVPGSAASLAGISSRISADADLPVLIAIDQEGGIVRRLTEDTGPAASALRGQSPSAAEEAFADRAALVASAGVTINFGIVADVTADTASFIYPRVLGTSASAAAPRVAAAVTGESGVVLSTLKHFPGHGSVAGDSHVSIPRTGMSYDQWWSSQAPPFAAGIDAGAELVMMGHLDYAGIADGPASLSPEWVRILRDDLGFDGIIVTDDMSMLERSGVAAYADQRRNAVAALAAGDTLLLYVGPVDVRGVVRAVAAAVEEGEIDEAVIDDAALRLLELRRGMSGRTGPFVHCGEACAEFAI